MALPTKEEENYFRIFKLVSGLAPKAVREKFDWYFPPSTLTSIVKKDEPTLRHYYHRGWLNGSQLSLLFPQSGSTSSSTYDLTLMICLLRNLTNIQPPVNGYESLPPTSEICDGADLARVKYYRNQIAHSDKDTLATHDFNKIWLDLTGAIIRLGGNQYKAKCDNLSQQKLDTDVNVKFMRIFQTFKDEVVREIIQLKQKTEECGCYDFHHKEINEWVKEHTKFVKTDAVEFVLQTIQENKRITVTGIPGIGKSALIRHVALHLCTEQGYNIIPCNSPSEIKTHFKEDRLQVFVFDDVCGRYILNQYDVEEWKKLQQSILGILVKTNTRIISSCRLQIFQERGFQNIALLSEFCCDLSSERFSLTKQQRIDIANQYIPEDTVDKIKDEFQKCDMFPLICSLFDAEQKINGSEFFANPFEFYTKELDKLLFESSDKIKICVLFLLVVNNGYVKKEWIVSEGRKRLPDMLDACGVNRGTCTMEIIQQFESLVNTYLKKVENEYKAIHDKLFDFLCFYFGQRMQEELIKYADRKVLYDRMFLCKLNELERDFSVVVTEKHENIYFQRIYKDLSDGFIIDVLYCKSIKFEKFHSNILNYLTTQNEEDMLKIVKTRYHYCGDTSLQIACSLGYNDIVKCMISFINDINVVQADEFPPLHQACFQGHDQIVKLFIDKGANLNIAGFDGWTPLMWACEGRRHKIFDLLVANGANVNEIIPGGRTLLTESCLLCNDTIVDWLIRSGAEVNLVDDTGDTPLTVACAKGHYQTILLLIQNGADANLCNKAGQTPIVKTVLNFVNNVKSRNEKEMEYNMPPATIFPTGEILLQIIDLLITNGADVNKPDNDGSTAIHEVCESNNAQYVCEIIKRKANVNQTLDDLRTPLMMACERGAKEVVECLLDNGADVNLADDEGSTSILLACENKHFDIAKYLISKGAHVKQVLKNINRNMITNHYFDTLVDNLKDMDINWFSEAAIIGNIDIVSYLIEKGAIVNSMTDLEKYTLLLNSCRGNYENIVQFLINEGTDVNKQTKEGKSALLTACLAGNYKIVEILVHAGSNVNSMNATNETPLMIACLMGNIPIAQFLIDKGADVNISDIHGDTALIHAIRYETVCLASVEKCKKTLNIEKLFPLVRVLLQKKVCINHKNVIGDFPLIIAINAHCEELSILLMDNNADIYQKDTKGYTPLMIAVKNKLENVVIEIMNRIEKPEEVDIDCERPDFIIVSVENNDIENMCIHIKDININTILEVAFKYYKSKIVLFLLDTGVDIEKNAKNETSLLMRYHQYCGKIICETLSNKSLDTATTYCNPNILLKLAVCCRLNNAALMLLDEEVDIELTNQDGKTLLMLTVEKWGSALYTTECFDGKYIFKALLDKGANWNAVDNNGNSVLMIAVYYGCLPAVIMLLNKSDYAEKYNNDGTISLINKVNKDGKTPLMLAYARKSDFTYILQNNSLEIIDALLDRGAEINAVDKDGNTALGLVINSGLNNIAMKLLDKGADINTFNKDGKTPLMLAVELELTLESHRGHRYFKFKKTSSKNFVNTLLDRGAKINAADNDGNTVLEIAINLELYDTAIKLLDKGAGINRVNRDGKTPIMLAVALKATSESYRYQTYFSHILHKTLLINSLLDRGAKINAVDNDGNTVLEEAIKSGLNDIAMRLLDKGADINKGNKDGKTPLMLAVEFKTTPESYRYHTNFSFILHKTLLINSLLDRGAEINAVDNDGNTVLEVAIKLELYDTSMKLLDKGAHINRVNRDGKTPLILAAELKATSESYRYQTCFSHILHKTLLINSLVDRGAEINAVDNDGNTVLELAIKSGLNDIAMKLFDKGADINKVNTDGKTPLMLAVEFGKTSELYRDDTDFGFMLQKPSSAEFVIFLLDRGADINAVDNDGNAVLGLAVKVGFTEGIKILLDKGMDVNKVNKDGGKSPLMVAIDVLHTSKSTEITSDVVQTDNLKLTRVLKHALHCIEILKILLNSGAVVNAADIQDNTVFGVAIQYGIFNAVKMFFERVLDINDEKTLILKVQSENDNISSLREETRSKLQEAIITLIEIADSTTAKREAKY